MDPGDERVGERASVDEREVLARLRVHLATLYRAGLGRSLIARSGSAAEIVRASAAAIASLDGVTPVVAERLRSDAVRRQAQKELRRVARGAISIWLADAADASDAADAADASDASDAADAAGGADDEARDIATSLEGIFSMPEPLRELPDMPVLLFVRGAWRPADALAVGIVGSRRPTSYGERQARRFAGALASWGVPITSGLARGIDGIAQREALARGGRSIAVLGSGLGRVYPPEHRDLVERIASDDRGAVVSEFPFDTPPRSFHFPQRNRLLSGLSRALLVVEAGDRSGSLITADWALAQGKTVYAIPGRIDCPQARGALALIRDGAMPVLDPEDLLGRAPGAKAARRSRERPLTGPFAARLDELFAEEDVWSADAIAARLDVDSSQLLAELGRLEFDGLLGRDRDGGYSRCAGA